ncbi:non-ribosomal peptide synthetase [Flavobacterium aquidurense]|uniref:Nonribosomal peptide synthetase n=1 Tax=Flavobacterium aquidurense TaxID=362413 RepID=A0A0Q0W427_9FLAO|nr:non-ribosomal peptide synthetase [Flavobacterium aquidurense]KQB41358.1 Nonribosomal peptide synthetase [Flavobacterium aquidurense]
MGINSNIEGYELSENQKNLWGLGNIGQYFNQIKIELKFDIAQDKLLQYIEKVVSKNEILHYKMMLSNGFTYPIQIDAADTKTEWSEIDLDANYTDATLDEKLNYTYDPLNNQPLRFCFAKESGKIKFIYIRFYSLWSDSYSPLLFCEYLLDEINAQNNPENKEDTQTEKIEYSGFSSWQNELISEPEPEAVDFWKNYAADFGNKTIPFNDFTNSFTAAKRQVYNIEKADYNSLKTYCEKNDVKVETVLLYNYLKYLMLFAEDEVSIGYIPFERKYKELANTFGYVNNIIPFKFNNNSELSIKETVDTIAAELNNVSDWSDFFTIDRENKIKNSSDFYFKYCFEYIDLSKEVLQNTIFEIKDLTLIQDSFDLKLSCTDNGNSIAVEVYFNEEAFGTDAKDIVAEQLKNVFTALTEPDTADSRISELENKIITQSNTTQNYFPEYDSVIALFEAQVNANPEHIALLNDDFKINYQELNEKANHLKNYLTERYDIQPGDAVSYLGNATDWYVISVLAILKAGAYFIPIDTNYPNERINYILQESTCKVLICDPNLTIDFDLANYNVLTPSFDEIAKSNNTDQKIEYNKNDVAYCIYTSGSTGNPKGCTISQSNLLNYVQWCDTFYFENAQVGNWGLFTSISFDLSITALFLSLIRGKKLWISNFDKEINVLLKESFNNPQIDTLKITPAHISLLKDVEIKNTTIKKIICGGEKLLHYHIQILKNIREDIEIYNEYGPTECTVGCIVSQVMNSDSKVLVGKPIANTEIYILNKDSKPCHIGEVGEIFVGGSGVSVGYLNRSDLTSEKFIANPFDNTQKLYTTGDLACWLPDGNIEYLGRKDHQVKIRGYRIELEEIEKAILQFSTDIAQVVVDAKEMNDDKILIAYLVCNKIIDKTKLSHFLKEKLPAYMNPGFIVNIDKIPLTSNGKIDRKLLPNVSVQNFLRAEYVAPQNEIQRQVAEIWQDLLKIEKIGINDNFIELGGHSLVAVQVFNRIYKELGKTISLRLFFENPTIKKLVDQLKENEFFSIEKTSEQDSYPLTASQNRFWILSQFEEASLAYNMQTILKFKGTINIAKFEDAFTNLINRHENLRTSFRALKNGEVRQIITPIEDVEFKMQFLDFSHTDLTDKAVDEYFEKENSKPFELENSPLLRTTLIKTQDEEYVFSIALPHIIGDGWSMEILAVEVVKIYNALIQDKDIDLPQLNIQYKDYAVWLNQEVKKDKYKISGDYWLNQFSGDLPVVNLPSVKKRPLIKTYNGDYQVHEFSNAFLEKLNIFSKENDVTLFMTLMSVINTLLHKYTGNEDIIVGSPIAGREHPDLENQVGLYLNTLALRTKVEKDTDFMALLHHEKEVLLQAFEHQNYPFDELIDQLNFKRDISRSVLFDIIVTLQSQEKLNNFEKEDILDLEVHSYNYKNTTSKFDIEFNFIESDALTLGIKYNTDVYDLAFIEKIFVHFEHLSSALIAAPSKKISEINYLSDTEKAELLLDFNPVAVSYPKDQTFLDLFEEQLSKTPDAVALVYEELSFTYKELNERSNQLADSLQQDYAIKKGDPVGVLLSRTEWVMISILGILKAGGVYVPIEPQLPNHRKAFVAEDTGLNLLITETFYLFDIDFYNKDVLAVDVEFEPLNYNKDFKRVALDTQDLAYIIYTSGSTGNPKGVMINHESLFNYLFWSRSRYLDNDLANTNFGLFTSLSFDLTITSLFLPIISGGSLNVFNSSENISDVLRTYFESDISCVKLTPAHISVLESLGLASSKVEVAIVGGEALGNNHVAILRRLNPSMKIYNEYGPTEATVGCIVYEIKAEEDPILIGTPISNFEIYILDPALELVGVGIVGEIYISGTGLSAGYLNRAELTAEKFIANPFKAGERMYKTGDLARWLSDGNIDYKGREDDQVKIKGYRIELGEIESVMAGFSQDITQAVVKISEYNGEKYIVAYYVSEKKIDKKVLQNSLNKILPDYMLPGFYVQLDFIPLTSNGKIDHKLLPDVAEKDLIKEEYVAPTTKEEELLVAIWSEVLKYDAVSIKESFYNLGGDSIKSILVVSRLKQMGYTLKVDQILRNPILEDLAKLVKSNFNIVDQSEITGEVQLTPIQYYFFESDAISNKNHYNQSVLLKSKSTIDPLVLNRSIKTLVVHHDALRMGFKFENNAWSQYNHDTAEEHYKINFYDLTHEADQSEALNQLGSKLQSGFDINSGILFQIGHFRMSDGDRLALIVHHLVIDGVSWRILLEDLSNLYSSFLKNDKSNLPLKTDSFQLWASRQAEYAKTEKIQQTRLYWEEISKEEIALLPTDYVEQNNTLKTEKSNGFVLDQSLTQKLQTKVHDVYNTEINDILLTGLGLAIRDVFGVEKSVVKMEGHGREEIIDGIDIGRTVGWFTSVYPFILDVSQSDGNALVTVKESLRKIPNKGIDYGILNYLDKRFTNDLAPSIQFNYLGDFGNNVGGDKEEALFEFSSENIGRSIDPANNNSTILLNVSGIMVSGQLSMSIRYSDTLFNDETIENLVVSYQNQLENLIDALAAEKKNYLTPSDLTYKNITYTALTALNEDNNVEDIYTLSPLQQGMYYHWLLDKSSPAYFEQFAYTINTDGLDINSVKQAYDALISRYSILRTRFTNTIGGVPLQIVYKNIQSNFSYQEMSENDTIEQYIDKVKEQDKTKGFDFENPSQMRLTVVGLTAEKFVFIWSHHHILMDGWCMSILVNDFYSILTSINTGQPGNLSKPVKYSEYISWLSDIDKNVSLNYWKNYLHGIESSTHIPFKRKKQLAGNAKLTKESFQIEGDLFDKLKNLCQEIEITPSTFMQGVWGYLLSRYNNTQDAVFGSIVSGRPGELSGVENMVGLFINTIPVRVQYDKGDSPKAFLKKLHTETLKSTAHHYINLSEVQAQSIPGMELINNLMVFENYLIQEAVKEEIDELYSQKEQKLTIEEINVFEQTNYDFSTIIAPSASAFKVEFRYNPNVFDAGLIKNLSAHFSGLVAQFCSDSEIKLSHIDYITKEEKTELIEDFNNGDHFLTNKSLVDLFADQLARTPDNIAVFYDNKELTYKELDTVSSQLSNILTNKFSIIKGEPVGVQLNRSQWSIISILAILKAGGVYVPIDFELPDDRKRFIIEDTQLKLLISEDSCALELEYYTGNIFLIDHNYWDLAAAAPAEKVAISPDDLAYVIYTSGSTGQPKGVMVQHSGVVNTILSLIDALEIKEAKRSLQYLSFSFDASISEIFVALLSGCSLYVIGEEKRKDTALLGDYIIENEIELATLPAAIFKIIDINSLKGLSTLITGGESPNIEKINQFLQYGTYHNEYGPTETSICATIYKKEKGSKHTTNNVPIGKPLSNVDIYIMDDLQQLQPKEIVGEICIGGKGLAKGYLNQIGLTAEKFISNPFKKGEKIYKTGDLGKWLSDGTVEFLGRIDDQLKIRGHRIELGEIESVLAAFSNELVKVVVEAKEQKGEKVLVAYYVSTEDINKRELRAYLQNKLPLHMVPNYYVEVENIPLTTNGKVDRKSLPEVSDADMIRREYIAPSNDIERVLSKIWQDVLQVKTISITDNFFELGGHSIKAIAIISEIQKEFDLKIKIADLFQHSTIQELSDEIEKNFQESNLHREIVDKITI